MPLRGQDRETRCRGPPMRHAANTQVAATEWDIPSEALHRCPAGSEDPSGQAGEVAVARDDAEPVEPVRVRQVQGIDHQGRVGGVLSAPRYGPPISMWGREHRARCAIHQAVVSRAGASRSPGVPHNPWRSRGGRTPSRWGCGRPTHVDAEGVQPWCEPVPLAIQWCGWHTAASSVFRSRQRLRGTARGGDDRIGCSD